MSRHFRHELPSAGRGIPDSRSGGGHVSARERKEPSIRKGAADVAADSLYPAVCRRQQADESVDGECAFDCAWMLPAVVSYGGCRRLPGGASAFLRAEQPFCVQEDVCRAG